MTTNAMNKTTLLSESDRKRERGRERERQTDRDRDRQTNRQTDRLVYFFFLVGWFLNILVIS